MKINTALPWALAFLAVTALVAVSMRDVRLT